MKKAKIMLTVIVVLGLAGGVFAFKAHKGLSTYYKIDANSNCTIAAQLAPTVAPSGADFQATTVYNAACKTLRLTDVEP